MELRELLPATHIVVPLEAGTLAEATRVLVARLVQEGAISDPEAVERLVADTGFRDVVEVSDRVALPHYRTDAVDRLLVALGVAPKGVEGKRERRAPAVEAGRDSRDAGLPGEAPATRLELVVLILAPREASTVYLQTVSALARLFKDPAVVDALAQARTPADVLSIPPLRQLKIQPKLTVRDIMVPRAPSVSPDTSLGEAVQLMVTRGLRALPVVGEKEEVLGMVTNRDVMRALLPLVPRAGDESEEPRSGEGPRKRPVRDLMDRSVLCVSEDMGLTEVANMMINKDVEQVPVVSEGRLSGMLSRGEIIRKIFTP